MHRFAIILFFVSTQAIAQNLIPNPSFECGNTPCENTNYLNIESFPNRLCAWYLPTTGTSDIFSTKADSGCWAYPVAPSLYRDGKIRIGLQTPRSGNRFAGIYTYSHMVSSYPSYREYLQVKLASPLVPGETYCAEMFVSPGDQVKYVSNNLGMYFHEYKIVSDRYSSHVLQYEPQINEETIIADTKNWIRIYKIFQAESPAEYVTIGNFYDDYRTLYTEVGGTYWPQDYEYAYYFIDDVYVAKLGDDTFKFSGDTVICDGQTASVTAVGPVDVKWTTLADTSSVIHKGETLTVRPSITTSYRVKGRACNDILVDTVTVTVNQLPYLELGKDTTICHGKTLQLDAGDAFSSVSWSNGSKDRYALVDRPGKYWVSVTNEWGCASSDNITVSLLTKPSVDLGKDTVVCKDFFPLDASFEHSVYEWSTGSKDPVIVPSDSGVYWVTVKNHCGQVSDTIRIHSLRDIFIPNAITVNNDRKNDKFEIAGIGPTEQFTLSILNRWGDQIYYDKNYKNSWPTGPDHINDGIYFYHLQHRHCPDYKGWIRVIK